MSIEVTSREAAPPLPAPLDEVEMRRLMIAYLRARDNYLAGTTTSTTAPRRPLLEAQPRSAHQRWRAARAAMTTGWTLLPRDLTVDRRSRSVADAAGRTIADVAGRSITHPPVS